MYPDYLVHFNPNHDPKTGQFTFSKYLNKNGNLTDYAKDAYGISKLNQSQSAKNVGYKQAQKMIQKDLKSLRKSGMRWLESDVREDYADAKFEYDIDKANNNKSLIKDLKSGVQKYFQIENDDWDAAYDYQESLKKELQIKYPESSEILSWVTIGETVNSKTVDKWLSSDNPFPDILNNDAYYEPMDMGDEYVDEVIGAVNRELTTTFINKYGEQNIPPEWRKYVN